MKYTVAISALLIIILFGSFCTDAEAFFFNRKLKNKISSLEEQLETEQKDHKSAIKEFTVQLNAKQEKIELLKQAKKEAQEQLDAMQKEVGPLREKLQLAEKELIDYEKLKNQFNELKSKAESVERQYKDLLAQQGDAPSESITEVSMIGAETDVLEVDAQSASTQ